MSRMTWLWVTWRNSACLGANDGLPSLLCICICTACMHCMQEIKCMPCHHWRRQHDRHIHIKQLLPYGMHVAMLLCCMQLHNHTVFVSACANIDFLQQHSLRLVQALSPKGLSA